MRLPSSRLEVLRKWHEWQRARARVRAELESLGIRRRATVDAPIFVLAAALLAAIVAVPAVAVLTPVDAEVAAGVAAVIVTLAVGVIGLVQWRDGLAEKALDALYQRITLANEMQLSARNHETTVTDRFRFYVFTEIDSLEYALRRYRSGLGLQADIVLRAIAHFEDKCKKVPGFSAEAAQCVTKGSLVEGAYFDETKDIVKKIVDQCGRRSADAPG